MTQHHINVRSPKGGQGATTISALVGLSLARAGYDTLLVDEHRSDDIYRVIGCPVGGQVSELHLPLTLTNNTEWIERSNRAFVVWDHGTMEPSEPDHPTIWVLRNEYVALVRMVAHHTIHSRDHVVLVHDHRRGITVEDTRSTLGVSEVLTIPEDPVVTRATDAGLLIGRTPFISIVDNLTQLMIKNAA